MTRAQSEMKTALEDILEHSVSSVEDALSMQEIAKSALEAVKKERPSFDFAEPIRVDNGGVIVDGHARVAALRAMEKRS